MAVLPASVLSADSIDRYGPADMEAFLALAYASEMAYDDSQPGLETTPSGCTALVRKDADGNVVIAFRGSMHRDRKPRRPFSNLGGANIRRAYRDWVATNLKQTAGFLPRQYVEAAALVEELVRETPVDKRISITGHSKGGGAATYAYIAASVSPDVAPEQARRMHCATFNAAVVKEMNWHRLFRRLRGDPVAAERELASDSVFALVMEDDPVSKIAAGEERRYVKRVVIAPTRDLSSGQQHAIRVIIEELEKRLRR